MSFAGPNGITLACENVPFPLPRKTPTPPKPLAPSNRSGMPSPFTSAVIGQPGPDTEMVVPVVYGAAAFPVPSRTVSPFVVGTARSTEPAPSKAPTAPQLPLPDSGLHTPSTKAPSPSLTRTDTDRLRPVMISL